MRTERSEAAVIVAGHMVGMCNTTLSNGSRVFWGAELTDEGILIINGRGTISRARKYLDESYRFDSLLHVNDGGGGEL